MKMTILLAGVSLLASEAMAGNLSNVDGTLDTTLVDPAPALYPHFICAGGCSGGSGGGGGAVTQSGAWSVGVSNFPSVQTVNGAVSIPGVATSANQPALDVDGGGLAHITNFPALQAIGGTVTVGNLPNVQSVSGSVSISNLPASQAVTGTVSVGNFPTSQSVTGSVSVPGVATAANQPALDSDGGGWAHITNWPAVQSVGGSVAISNLPVTQAISGSVAVSNLPASQAVTGTVSVGNFPGTQTITGAVTVPGVATAANQPGLDVDGGGLAHVTNWPASQAVSGSVAISNLPASQAVTGSVTLVDPAPGFYPHFICDSGCSGGSGGGAVTQSGAWSVGVSNFPATQTVNGSVSVPGVATSANQPALNSDGGGLAHVTNWPASQPVSGSVSVGNFPATQIVSGTVSVGNFPANQTVSAASLPLPSGAATATNQTSVQSAPGTAQTTAFTIQGNASGIAVPVSNSAEAAALATLTTAAAAAVPCVVAATAPTYTNGSTQPQSCNLAGGLRVDGSGVTQPVSGTISVSGTVPVSGIFYQATQPVSLATAPNTPAQGVTASGAALTENPLAMGGRAATISPTPVTDGQKVATMMTPDGKAVVKPYAPSGLDWKAYQSTTASTAVTLQAAAGVGIKNYVTGAQCYNTSTTTITVAFNDSATTSIIVPLGSGNNAVFATPLATAAATALTFTPSAAETTIGCSAQGYTGP